MKSFFCDACDVTAGLIREGPENEFKYGPTGIYERRVTCVIFRTRTFIIRTTSQSQKGKG